MSGAAIAEAGARALASRAADNADRMRNLIVEPLSRRESGGRWAARPLHRIPGPDAPWTHTHRRTSPESDIDRAVARNMASPLSAEVPSPAAIATTAPADATGCEPRVPGLLLDLAELAIAVHPEAGARVVDALPVPASRAARKPRSLRRVPSR